MIDNYLIYIGLKKQPNNSLVQENDTNYISNTKETYRPSIEIKVAERYLTYLKEIHEYQNDRRTTIENKNAQLVGQASIASSIFALFVPLLITYLNGVDLWIKVPILIIFLIVILHYLLSILHAIKTLTVDKYKYPSRSTKSVTKGNRKEDELDFINSEIEDLIYIINNTTPIDNIKGENLIYGARCFKNGNIGFGIMTVLVIMSTFSLNNENPESSIKNVKELKYEMLDTLNIRIIDLDLHETLPIKIDSLNNKIYQFNKLEGIPK